MVGIVSTGIGSGLDVSGLVQQLLAAEAQGPTTRFATKEAGVLAKVSGYSSIKSALSVFQTAVERLKTTDELLGRDVTYEENDDFIATVTESAPPAQFDLEIQRLADSQKLASSAFASQTAAIGDGQLTISSGENTFIVSIDSEANTLADIQTAINQNSDNTSVRATIVNSDAGATLTISALQTGVANEITISSTGGDGGLSALEYDSASGLGSLSELRAAGDALVEIDGLAVTSDNNTLVDAVEGVTIELLNAELGTLRQIDIGYDQGQLRSNVQRFAAAYNDVVEVFTTQTRFDLETESAGALLGDTTLRNIRSQLRNEFSSTVTQAGTFNSLSSIGVTLDIDGKVQIDAEKLDDATATDYLQVGQLFTAEDGIATRFDERLTNYLASDGALETRTEGLNQTIEDIGEQRERLNQRLIQVEARLLRQFNALDSLVSQLSSTSNFLTQQLSALPTPGNSN